MDDDEKNVENVSKTGLTECPADSKEAGHASVCVGCPGRELCLSQGGPDAAQEYIDLRMKAIKHKILILSGKGGVGKSSLAANLAIALTYEKKKVALLDLDICGPNIPKLLGVEEQAIVNSQWGWRPALSPHGQIKVLSVGSLLPNNASSVAFRGPRKTGLIKRMLKDTLWGRLDFLVVDTPPGTSDEHLTVVKLLKSTQPDGAVIITTPQKVALDTVRREIAFCKKMGLRILGIVENMNGFVCPCCKEEYELFSTRGGQQLASEYGILFLGSLPIDPCITKCCETGRNAFEEHPDSPATQSLLTITKKLEALVKEKQ